MANTPKANSIPADATPKKLRLEFGLNAELPDSVTAAWGARWIFPNDMLGDRQSFPGMETGAGQILQQWLNDGKALAKASKAALQLSNRYELLPRDSETVTLYEDEVGIIKGNPLASFGYLYVVAYLKAEAL